MYTRVYHLRLLITASLILNGFFVLRSLSAGTQQSYPTDIPASDPSVGKQVDQCLEALDRFTASFPETRSHSDLGRKTKDDEGWYAERVRQGRAEFDWPTTQYLMSFGDSQTIRSHEYEYWKKEDKWATPLPLAMKWTDVMQLQFRNRTTQVYECFSGGGAVMDRIIVAPVLPAQDDFVSQIERMNRWAARFKNGVQGLSHLAVIQYGTNDFKQIAREHPREDDESNIIALAASLERNCDTLYNLGLRNFLLLSPPPIDQMPSNLPSQGGYKDRYLTKSLLKHLNSLLEQIPSRFEESHPQANFMYFDQDGYMRLIAQWPQLFGITDTKRFAIKVQGVERDRGQSGFLYNDFYGHHSGLTTHLFAGVINGYLHRHSRSFHINQAKDYEIIAD